MKVALHKPVKMGLTSETVPDPVEPVAQPRKHFSWSQMSMYLRCSMQYYFRYILGLRDIPSINMAVGSGVHGALEWNSKKKIATTKDMPLSDLKDLASDLLDIEMHEVGDTDKVKGTEKDKAINAVALFRRRDAGKIKPLVAEMPFSLEIAPNEQYPEKNLPVIGFIDAVNEVERNTTIPGPTPTTVALEDYKWVGQMRSQNEIDLTPQLTIYDLATHELTGSAPGAIGLRQFGFRAKDGPFSVATYRSSDLQQPATRLLRWERLRQQIRAVQDAIRKGVFMPTDDAKTCSWCPYRQICQYSLVKTSDETTRDSTSTTG